MDSAPSKRRKTSHTTSAPVDAPTTPSPPRPRREAAKARTTPRRASFLSPTKASIARFNPELIARPQSASSGDRRGKRNSILGPTSPTRRPLSPPKSSVTGSHAEASTAHESTTSSIAGSDATRTAPLQERTPAPSVDVALPPRGPLDTQSQGLRASPRRQSQSIRKPASASKGIQRPKSLGVSQREDIAMDARAENAPPSTRRRSSRLSGGSTWQGAPLDDNAAAVDGEPELPPMPAPLGEAATAINKGPVGLLSSPSRRSKRSRPQKTTPTSAAAERASTTRRAADINDQRAKKDTTQHGMDMDIVVVESAAREETREQLVSQLRELQEQVKDLERQVAQASAAAAANKKSPSERAPLSELHVTRISLNAFLPFSRRRRPAPKMAPSLPVRDDPPPSHHPIELDDPLPYLQIFTPLTFTSTTRDVARPSSVPLEAGTTMTNNGIAYHEHTITATSPQQLLTAIISMTVDATSHEITALQISSLSPWAEAELGRWIRSRASSDTPAGRDVSSICWAIGRYYLLAKRRAQFWFKCEQEFAELVTRSSPIGNMTSEKGKQRAGDGPPGKHRSKNDTANTRRILSRHLGRSSLTFRQGGVQLLVTWSITFDWTGEARSRVSATTGVPGAWKRADSRASLAKVPALFQTLVKDKGVLAATKVVVSLLFPD